MANIINADNGVSSGSAGLKSSSDGTGILALQTNGTTAVTVDASQVVSLTNALAVTSGGTGVTTSTGSGANVLGTSPTLTTPTINSAQIPTVSGTAPLYMCRAWVNFNGTGTVAIRASANVTSITDSGVGLYDVNFTTAMPDANYAIAVTAYSANSSLYAVGGQTNNQVPATTKFRIGIGAGSSFGSDTTAGYADLPYIFASVFR